MNNTGLPVRPPSAVAGAGVATSLPGLRVFLEVIGTIILAPALALLFCGAILVSCVMRLGREVVSKILSSRRVG